MTKSLLTVEWKTYLSSSNPHIDEYISLFGKDFLKQTFRKIKTAHLRKASRVVLIRFKGSSIISILYKKDYLVALEMLLQLCIRLEYYEICNDIKKTIKQIKGGMRKPKLAAH